MGSTCLTKKSQISINKKKTRIENQRRKSKITFKESNDFFESTITSLDRDLSQKTVQKQNITNTSAGGGNQIKIKCVIDEDVTYHVLYAHLYPNSAKVKVGDKVKHEQQIAEVGTTGYSTGPHLHFQVIKDGSNVDGMSLLDFTYESELPKTPSLPQYNPNINISPGGYNLP